MGRRFFIVNFKPMNPSATGWINKFFHKFSKEDLLYPFNVKGSFYKRLRKSGFAYGNSVSGLVEKPLSDLKLSMAEYNKANLLHGLYVVYSKQTDSEDVKAFLTHAISFYREIDRGRMSLFSRLSMGKSSSKNLEKILAARIMESDASLKKEQTYAFSNVLLATDLLTYQIYCESPMLAKNYATSLEKAIATYCFGALQSKSKQDKYDLLLLELFEMAGLSTVAAPLEAFFSESQMTLTSPYLLDLCCMAVKDDLRIEPSEREYIVHLAGQLNLRQNEAYEALDDLEAFMAEHKNAINFFNHTHPVQHFYKQTSGTVERLILRNKKRLLKELSESGELLVLLGQSTVRELDAKEKDKMKDQLLDMFKSIPSLTIFLLPGGSLLLPLFIKFIPKLLPSAFNENRIEKE